MNAHPSDSPALRQFEAFNASVDRELAAMEAQHLAAFHRCAPVGEREARDWLRAKAAALGFDALSHEITALDRDGLIKAGRMLAHEMFQKSSAASYECPSLTCWAVLESEEIAEILRALWVPKLIDRQPDPVAARLAEAAAQVTEQRIARENRETAEAMKEGIAGNARRAASDQREQGA